MSYNPNIPVYQPTDPQNRTDFSLFRARIRESLAEWVMTQILCSCGGSNLYVDPDLLRSDPPCRKAGCPSCGRIQWLEATEGPIEMEEDMEEDVVIQLVELDPDLVQACQFNDMQYVLDQIENVAMMLEGENDGAGWHWIVLFKDGKFGYITGGCSYTGWDACSRAELVSDADTLAEILQDVGLDERRVFEDMHALGEYSRKNTGGL